MKPFSLNIRGNLMRFERPAVMGIINLTPDSFYSGSRVEDSGLLKARVEEMVEAGADFIDVGACSTRPGAESVDAKEELRRLERWLPLIRDAAGEIPISIDTFRGDVARLAVTEFGADIVNDVSGGTADASMFAAVAELKVPYVLTHSRGDSRTMGALTGYADGVVATVAAELAVKLRQLRLIGVNDVIVDPGFGFAKTVEQNYELLDSLDVLEDMLSAPILAGISRKSMICKPLHIAPESNMALDGTICLNTVAILRGAAILRVHDVAEGRVAVNLTQMLPSMNTDVKKNPIEI